MDVRPLTINFLITLSLIKVCTFVRLSQLFLLISFHVGLLSICCHPSFTNWLGISLFFGGFFCRGYWPEFVNPSGFRLFSCFFSHHSFAKIMKEELPDIVYHSNGSPPTPFLQCPLFEDKIISPPFLLSHAVFKGMYLQTCRESLCLKYSQNNSLRINKNKNKQLQRPEHFFSS